MARKVKFELNSAGVVELLKSKEMEAVLKAHGDRVANTAGDGYEPETVTSGDRVKVLVVAKTRKAKRDNLKNNTLLKALGGSNHD